MKAAPISICLADAEPIKALIETVTEAIGRLEKNGDHFSTAIDVAGDLQDALQAVNRGTTRRDFVTRQPNNHDHQVVYDLRGFGRCERCNAPYLVDGEAVYGWCAEPECEREVISLGAMGRLRERGQS